MKFERVTGVLQLDFQLNRIISAGKRACNKEELIRVMHGVKDFSTWFDRLYKLGKRAESEGRYMHAAYYYRFSEFFLMDIDPYKERAYRLAMKNFAKEISRDVDVRYEEVAYMGTTMNTMVFNPNTKESKGDIVVFGGYDSFIEELYLSVKKMADWGYKIYLFEGPGQGSTLRKGLKFEPHWEKPLAAVLDYFGLDNVSVIGISWGGYYALRSAAKEKRVKNVIAYNILHDGFDCMMSTLPFVKRVIIKGAMKLERKNLVNNLIENTMKKDLVVDWGVSHGMFITGSDSPYEFFEHIKKHSLVGIEHEIECNVLLTAGEQDHYIPLRHYDILMKKVVNAKSLVGRVFTKVEGGEQHCQVGNYRLAMNCMQAWLSTVN